MNSSIVTQQRSDTSPALIADYLGPARVTALLTPCVEVRLPSGAVRLASMALAYPYHPAQGDVLLVAARADDTYVIGVLHGQGKTSLTFQGDVELRSIGGKVEIAAEESVVISAPKLDLVSDKLKVVADAVNESFNTCFTRVRELLTVNAGESRSIVRGFWFAQAERAQINTSETIGINGREVHLG